ncbi:hypothetical protein [Cupriavidus basilensis]|uniref:Uncharacterized protein n=1 Tax=Cupriavidus basilensis TaxID=68895 RepID=A0A0C4Y1T8_9BURK|nr:hypothetical protein [Cupriavidus basilensis]AJG19067.1 hypothetical protein RR42_m1670 [Cupriavidus basilensis]
MDAAKLQDRIYVGYAKAAKRIGYVYDVYRPASAANPLTAKVASLNASFSAQEWTYTKANLPSKPFWYCLMDGRETQLGDYLVYGQSVHFIAGMQSELPILTVECNARVWVTRPMASSGFGAQGYSCSSAHTDDYVLGTQNGAGWPASILFGSRTLRHQLLPTSADEHGYQILLPMSNPIALLAGDVITDDLARRFMVAGAERNGQLWRLDMTELHA